MVASLKQILVITDGCSNKGVRPEAMAMLAKEQNVTVNVIGIVENEGMTNGMNEIEKIALAGGGIAQYATRKQLHQTVQLVTQKAMTHTIANVVGQQLRSILGEEKKWTDVSPEKRGEIMEVVNDLTETVQLQLAILIDCSASMKDNIQLVKEALYDLSITLRSRQGANEFCVHVFPGKYDDCECILDWSGDMGMLMRISKDLTTNGLTPTGPAIRVALASFAHIEISDIFEERKYDEIG